MQQIIKKRDEYEASHSDLRTKVDGARTLVQNLTSYSEQIAALYSKAQSEMTEYFESQGTDEEKERLVAARELCEAEIGPFLVLASETKEKLEARERDVTAQLKQDVEAALLALEKTSLTSLRSETEALQFNVHQLVSRLEEAEQMI